ncbi:MAG: transrane sensor protein [Candidatus Eremiobacteraeota bacterium]|nr:transrane sensor protein [Candidatus Eremiobacteraeota bacterium]
MFDYDDDSMSGKTAILYCPNMGEAQHGSVSVPKRWIREPTIAELLKRREFLMTQWHNDQKNRAARSARARSTKDSIDTLLELLLVERITFDRIHEAEMSAQFLPPSRVFISYASHDSWFVRRLNAELSKHNVRAWMYEWHISPGQNIPVEISNALDSSDVILVVLSPASIRSMWVRQEWTTALTASIDRGCLLIPILLDDCERPALLRPLRYVDFRENEFEQPFNELLRALNKRLVT